MEPALERIDRDPELCGGLGRAQLLDVTEQDDLAMDRIEIGERGCKQLDTSADREGVLRIDDLGDQLVLTSIEVRGPAALTLQQPQTLAANDREEPARDRGRRASERPDRTRR